ncbi:MAG: YchJ family protein [Myxococcota bacterium]
MDCPCGSGADLDGCCGPILAGDRKAATAEALMRSRYSAYALKKPSHIVESNDPRTRDSVDLDAVRGWAERTEWLGLEVLDTAAGGEDDDEGEVEFVARFRDERGREHSHHERARFIRKEGRWYFHDGKIQGQAPAVRSEPKVGRNDPCPCGSGKKHKKCCGSPSPG